MSSERRNALWTILRDREIVGLVELSDLSGETKRFCRAFLGDLLRHKIVRSLGVVPITRVKSQEVFRLVRDTGPFAPTECPVCGRKITESYCRSSLSLTGIVERLLHG